MDKLLKTLCSARGISGDEFRIKDIIIEEIKDYADSITETPLGSIIVYKKGTAKSNRKLLINAHMDEVGLIITNIEKNGLVDFDCVGGIDSAVLPGCAVLIGEKSIPGVIGVKPVHLITSEEMGKKVPKKELYIDIGAKNYDEASDIVEPGDSVTFDTEYFENENYIFSKALDDRAGCAILISLIKNKQLKYDMYFVFSVQEEVGLNGSKTSTFMVEPDCAIVLESTTASDVPETHEGNEVCYLGKGPVISFMDRRTIYDKEYCRLAFKIAEKEKLLCQYKKAIAGGNDEGTIHISKSGVRTVAVSLACRYIHSPMSVISKSDFNSAKKLVAELAEEICADD